MTDIPENCVFRGFMTYRRRMYSISALFEYTDNLCFSHIHGIPTHDVTSFCTLWIYSKFMSFAFYWHTVEWCTLYPFVSHIPIMCVFYIIRVHQFMIYPISACFGYTKNTFHSRFHGIPSNNVPYICTLGIYQSYDTIAWCTPYLHVTQIRIMWPFHIIRPYQVMMRLTSGR